MREHIEVIANGHHNPLARQRAWGILRRRYGVQKPLRPQCDPVWLSAVGM